MKTIKLPSGKTLFIADIPWSTATDALQTVTRCLQGKVDLTSPESLIPVLLQLAGNPAIFDTVYALMANATLDGVPITKKTFEAVENRKDFLPIAKEVLSEALEPFFGSLDSVLSDSPGAS